MSLALLVSRVRPALWASLALLVLSVKQALLVLPEQLVSKVLLVKLDL